MLGYLTREFGVDFANTRADSGAERESLARELLGVSRVTYLGSAGAVDIYCRTIDTDSLPPWHQAAQH